MDSENEFFTVTYPRIWHLANDAGKKARQDGLSRICNLKDELFCHGETVLKVYKSAWEQGWDGYEIPAIFKQMEVVLDNMPLHQMMEDDL